MAEYSKERLYFLKLSKDFFQSYKMRALEGIPRGKDYELMYLKLICESVSHNGYLRFDEMTPYTVDMIAGITNTPVDTVRVGIGVLQQFGLVEITESKTLFIPQVPQMTGSTTIGAQKKQAQLGRRVNEVERKVEEIPPREYRELDNGLSTNVSNPVEKKNSESKRRVKKSKKQNPLLKLLLNSEFIDESDLIDPMWQAITQGFIDSRIQELGEKKGFLDAKKRMQYVIRSISAPTHYGDDRNGKPLFRYIVRDEVMETIADKQSWLEASLYKAVRQLEVNPFSDIMDDDDKLF